ncbi:GGDEF domain-containing protein [Aquibacillus koreensis]|uniref:GGDEF domain-containing protein n=1 Tax=Aquibacillus koreensis TaxID=279446 RepID=A0A9X3WNF4_9BACI|nr:GGDEF domain-containing protein [Aquibacillus koreensis]MCT2535998.1 GGDEF domain-containing protein [Aquibacillus koreensis]MDC3420454.1 GGDEF domain-containing protein [Aquibacillus koreensis]
MHYIVQFQINIFAIVILIVLYLIIKTKSKVKSYSKQILKYIMIASAVAIIMEPLTWIFDGMTFFGAYFLEYSTNFILFMIGPILGGLMLSYVDYHLFKDPKRIYKKRFYQGASAVTFIILIINIFYPLYFQINPETVSFSSGDYKGLHYLVLASLYVYMFLLLILNRKRIRFYALSIFLVFFMLPIIGMVVQLFESRLYFSWTSIVLGILVAYIFLETSSSEEDYLTKIYNRHSYETYVQHFIEVNKKFGVILIDLDNFKEINDQYGHDKGDQVLIAFAQVLKKVFHTNSLVSRLGGDEFIVVIEKSDTKVEQYISSVEHLLKNHDVTFINQLTFSYGYQQYLENMTVDELYSKVDKKMYNDKSNTSII